MSDLDRNYTSPFGRAAGRVDTATVDAGLRSYMLKVYNYMAIGLAIGFASPSFADNLPEVQRLIKQGQYPQAMEKVDAYLSSRPKDAQGRFLKGLIFTEMNKPAEAIAVFTKLSEDYPELPEPYNNLAVLYAQQKQYDKARTALEMAIRTHPSYAIAYENLGDVYAKLASQAYSKALQLDANNTGVHEKISTAFARLDYDDTVGGVALKGNAGLQVVHAQQNATGWEYFGDEINPDPNLLYAKSGGASYADVLPTLNGSADYCVSKAGVWMLTKIAARVLAPKGIRVNGLSAGPIKTLAASGIKDFGKLLTDFAAMAPIRRAVTIEDVGNVAAFLLSDLAAGVSAEITYVDGGFSQVMAGSANA